MTSCFTVGHTVVHSTESEDHFLFFCATQSSILFFSSTSTNSPNLTNLIWDIMCVTCRIQTDVALDRFNSLFYVWGEYDKANKSQMLKRTDHNAGQIGARKCSGDHLRLADSQSEVLCWTDPSANWANVVRWLVGPLSAPKLAASLDQSCAFASVDLKAASNNIHVYMYIHTHVIYVPTR